MANLTAVNQTLSSQNEILLETQEGIARTNSLLVESLDRQAKAASFAKLQRLEDKSEGGRFKQVAGGLTAAGGAIKSGVERGAGGLQGMLGKMGAFLTPAALMALPRILGSVLLRRGIPALAVGVFSDEIAEFLLGPDAKKDMKEQVSKAIKFGAAGSLLGKRFALIGAAAGFLIDDEVAAQLKTTAVSFGKLFDTDIKSLDDLKEKVLEPMGKFLRGGLTRGLEGINDLLNGDIKKFFGAVDGPAGQPGENKVFATLGLLTGLGLLISPKGTLGVAILAAKAVWGTAKFLSSITGLTALGNSILGAGAAAPGAAARGAQGFASRVAGGIGRTGLFASAGRAIAFMGPAGLVIAGAAGLTYLGMVAGEAFQTTDMYRDLLADQKKREEESKATNEAIKQRIDAGMDPLEAEREVRALQLARNAANATRLSKGANTVRDSELPTEIDKQEKFLATIPEDSDLYRRKLDELNALKSRARILAANKAAVPTSVPSKTGPALLEQSRQPAPDFVMYNNSVDQSNNSVTSTQSSAMVMPIASSDDPTLRSQTFGTNADLAKSLMGY